MKLFRALDVDCDGFLNQEELHNTLISRGWHATEAQAQVRGSKRVCTARCVCYTRAVMAVHMHRRGAVHTVCTAHACVRGCTQAQVRGSTD